MAVKFSNLESLLISKASALIFAVLGIVLGSVAYLKFKAVPETTVATVIKDTRDPAAVDRENRLNKANALVQRKLYKNAEEILTALYKEIPKNAHVLSLLAISEKKIGQLENAETHLKEAIALEPGQWMLHNNLGVLLFDKGKPVDALKSFQEAIKLSPKNYQVLLSQGKVQELTGKFTDARLSYGKALESGKLDAGTSAVVKDRLKKLDVLAFIERGDK